MNRRAFLQIFLLGYPIGFKLAFSGLKGSRFKVIYQSIPKVSKNCLINQHRVFFHQFYGRQGSDFNMKNIQSNKVLNIKSYLSPNGKTVRSEYIYKNRQAFMECEKLWQERYPNHLDPVKHIIVGIA